MMEHVTSKNTSENTTENTSENITENTSEMQEGPKTQSTC